MAALSAPRLLLATTNPGKLEELYGLLGDLDLCATDASRMGLRLEVDETGSTYAENANLKARAFAEAADMPALADDSGLEVAALHGAPGLRSRRLAGSDEERRRRLLELLAPHPRPWKAVFRCAMVLALPSGALVLAQGECPGEIVPQARGRGGFGYDPIFQLSGTESTMAELPLPQKNRLSHRARAFLALAPDLVARLGPGS
jgi:XTP/dITP diphosphohydrolase